MDTILLLHVHHETEYVGKIYKKLKKKLKNTPCEISLSTLENNSIKLTYNSENDANIRNIIKSYEDIIIMEKHNTSSQNFLQTKHKYTFSLDQDNIATTNTANIINARDIINYGNTPIAMAKYYNFPSQKGTPPTIAIISLGGTYLTSDLDYYWGTVLGLPKSQYPSVSYVKIDNSTNAPNQPITTANQGESIENTLDIQMVGGICPGCKIIVYLAPNTNSGFYNAIKTAISGPANIISISWGGPENSWGSNLVNYYNNLFQTTIGTKKIICAASGDSGSNDGVSGSLPHVDFPASSPYVLACGGTSIVNPNAESAWSWDKTNNWGGGGGLSQYFAKPTYQNNIVPTITTTSSTINSLNNHRAIPDVSLNADPLSGVTIYFNGQLYVNGIGGTSVVAPIMSGFFGLCNLNSNLTNGIHSKLYNIYANNKKKTSCFKDITTGSNNNISTKNVYNASSNFDMCTGMGSINGVNLYNALIA